MYNIDSWSFHPTLVHWLIDWWIDRLIDWLICSIAHEIQKSMENGKVWWLIMDMISMTSHTSDVLAFRFHFFEGLVAVEPWVFQGEDFAAKVAVCRFERKDLRWEVSSCCFLVLFLMVMGIENIPVSGVCRKSFRPFLSINQSNNQTIGIIESK